MATSQLSRNARCKCGSGLKYKKCCMLKKFSGSRNESPAKFAPRSVYSDGASVSPAAQQPQPAMQAIQRVGVHFTFPEQFGAAKVEYSFPVGRIIVLEGGFVTPVEKLAVGSRFVMQDGEIATVTAVKPPVWYEPPTDQPIQGRFTGRRVIGRSERVGNEVIDLTFCGQKVTASPDHLFYSVSRRAYLPAKQLQVGELLATDKGGTATIDSISAPRFGLVKLYNIEVEELHNYFIGASGSAVRVHNGVPGAAGSGIPMPAEASAPPGNNDSLDPFTNVVTSIAGTFGRAAWSYVDATVLGGWGGLIATSGVAGMSGVMTLAARERR